MGKAGKRFTELDCCGQEQRGLWRVGGWPRRISLVSTRRAGHMASGRVCWIARTWRKQQSPRQDSDERCAKCDEHETHERRPYPITDFCKRGLISHRAPSRETSEVYKQKAKRQRMRSSRVATSRPRIIGRGLLWRGVKVMIGMRGGDLTRTADDLSQTHTPDIVGRSYLVALYLDHSGSAEPKCAAPTPWSTSGAAGRLSGANRM